MDSPRLNIKLDRCLSGQKGWAANSLFRGFESLFVLNEIYCFIIRIIGVMASINGSNPFGQGSSPWWCANQHILNDTSRASSKGVRVLILLEGGRVVKGDRL